MRDKLIEALSLEDPRTLDSVKNVLLSVLEDLRLSGQDRIGYIPGIISSDGEENISRNVQRLSGYADAIQELVNFPVFAPTDAINNNVYKSLDISVLPPAEREDSLNVFWSEVLGGGYITHMFATPRWEESRGAMNEHNIAKRMDIKIIYLGIEE